MRIELKNFSGGITDYILSDDSTCCEIQDNLLIDKNVSISSRAGSAILGSEFIRPITSTTRNQAIHEMLSGDLVFAYGKDLLAFNSTTGWATCDSFTTNGSLPMGDINSRQNLAEWNKHLFITDTSGSKPIKLYKDQNGNYKAITSGLPDLKSEPKLTSSNNDVRAYVYTFCYMYTYYVGTSLFKDFGPTTKVQILNATAFGSGEKITIDSIPTLTNDIYTNRDINNIKLNIYRTADTGTVSYLVASIANGTTSYIDIKTDVDLVEGESLYTDGGISINNEPPIAKYFDICNSAGWYANIKDFPYRVMQSQIGDPDSVPLDYYLDFENEVTAISSYQSNPIVFTETQVFRIEGMIELDGSGYQKSLMVGSRVGAINANSVVKTDSGIYFCGHDSFYWTNGYDVKPIPSAQKNIFERYKAIAANPSFINGTYDRLNQRVYWTTKISASEYLIYVYDMTFNALSTMSGAKDSFNTTSVCSLKDGSLIRGDLSGYIFRHSDDLLNDPVIDLSSPVENWGVSPVIYKWRHIAFDFGVPEITKYVTRVTLEGGGSSDADIAISSYDDSNVIPKELFPIRFVYGLTWNDENWIWEDSDTVWELEKRLLATRWFKSGKLRCKRKQLEITNAITKIASSVDNETDTYLVVNSVTKLATLVNPASTYMPSYSKGMSITINNFAYEVISNNGDTVQLSDPRDRLVDGTFPWKIEGYKPSQRLDLKSVIYTYEMLDDKGSYYSRGENVV